jgi:hypothetical protein
MQKHNLIVTAFCNYATMRRYKLLAIIEIVLSTDNKHSSELRPAYTSVRHSRIHLTNMP